MESFDVCQQIEIALTDDEVVLIGFKFVTPQVGRVLLKLDGEAHIIVGLSQVRSRWVLRSLHTCLPDPVMTPGTVYRNSYSAGDRGPGGSDPGKWGPDDPRFEGTGHNPYHR